MAPVWVTGDLRGAERVNYTPKLAGEVRPVVIMINARECRLACKRMKHRYLGKVHAVY